MNSLCRMIVLWIGAFLSMPSFGQYHRVNLISPETCTLQHDRLFACKFTTQELKMTSISDPSFATLPRKTKIRAVVGGKCASRFPITIKVETEVGSTNISVLTNGEKVIRNHSQLPINKIHISDGTAFTSLTSFDATCRSYIEIESNILDSDNEVDDLRILKTRLLRLGELSTYLDLIKNYIEADTLASLFEEMAREFLQELGSSSIAPSLEYIPPREEYEDKDLESFLSAEDQARIIAFKATKENMCLKEDARKIVSEIHLNCLAIERLKQEARSSDRSLFHEEYITGVEICREIR